MRKIYVWDFSRRPSPYTLRASSWRFRQCGESSSAIHLVVDFSISPLTAFEKKLQNITKEFLWGLSLDPSINPPHVKILIHGRNRKHVLKANRTEFHPHLILPPPVHTVLWFLYSTAGYATASDSCFYLSNWKSKQQLSGYHFDIDETGSTLGFYPDGTTRLGTDL